MALRSITLKPEVYLRFFIMSGNQANAGWLILVWKLQAEDVRA
jgi:hypothetical protein